MTKPLMIPCCDCKHYRKHTRVATTHPDNGETTFCYDIDCASFLRTLSVPATANPLNCIYFDKKT